MLPFYMLRRVSDHLTESEKDLVMVWLYEVCREQYHGQPHSTPFFNHPLERRLEIFEKWLRDLADYKDDQLEYKVSQFFQRELPEFRRMWEEVVES